MAFKASNSGIFSRLSAKRKRSGGKQTSSDDAEPDNNEEIAEEFASLTDEHMLEKASVDVQSEISGIKHPVMYESTTFAKWRLKINLYFSRLRRSGKCASILKSHLTQETPNQLWLGKKWSKIAHSRKSKIIRNASFKQSFRYIQFKFHNFVNDICDSLVYLDSGLYVVDL